MSKKRIDDATLSKKEIQDADSCVKFDRGKLRFDLLPPDALKAVVAIFTYGANKYADRNWEKGTNYGRLFGAAQRHLWNWWDGEENDPESGLHHLAHAITDILFLLSYELRGVGNDDRGVTETTENVLQKIKGSRFNSYTHTTPCPPTNFPSYIPYREYIPWYDQFRNPKSRVPDVIIGPRNPLSPYGETIIGCSCIGGDIWVTPPMSQLTNEEGII